MTSYDNDNGKDQSAGSLLKPSDALSRFVPLTPTHLGSELGQEAQLRYGFRIGHLGLLVPVGTVSELIDDVPVYPIPNTPIWLLGLINLRGNLVPIFDLRTLFELPEETEEDKHILVIDQGDKAIGIPIYSLPMSVDTSHRLAQVPPLPPVLREHIRNVYAFDDQIWLDFHSEGLFEGLGAQIAA